MQRIYLIFICAMLLMGVVSGQQSQSMDGPSLADVARQKKAKPATKHVITNEDIPSRAADTGGTSSNGATSSGSSSAASGNTQPASDSKARGTKSDEAKKSTNAEAITDTQTKVDNLKHDEEVITKGVKKIEDLIANGDDFRKNMMADTLQHQRDNLAETQKKRQAAENELDKLKNPKKQ